MTNARKACLTLVLTLVLVFSCLGSAAAAPLPQLAQIPQSLDLEQVFRQAGFPQTDDKTMLEQRLDDPFFATPPALLEPLYSSNLSSIEIGALVEKTVFKIYMYDAGENPLGSGSGFFIEQNGVGVTNYHVMEGAYYMDLQMEDGTWYEVTKILAYDSNKDLVIFQSDATNTAALPLGDSSSVVRGERNYLAGYPLGYPLTLSDGIISNPSYSLVTGNEEVQYLQTTAAALHGNSGGPILNEAGEVIAILSWGPSDVLNFGVYSDYLKTMPRNVNKTLAELYTGQPATSASSSTDGQNRIIENENQIWNHNDDFEHAQSIPPPSTVYGKLEGYFSYGGYYYFDWIDIYVTEITSAGTYSAGMFVGSDLHTSWIYAIELYLLQYDSAGNLVAYSEFEIIEDSDSFFYLIAEGDFEPGPLYIAVWYADLDNDEDHIYIPYTFMLFDY